MEQETIFRLIAHFSLLLYIGVLAILTVYLRSMIRDKLTKYAYAILCFCLLLALKDLVYLFGDIWYNDKVANILMSIDLWTIPAVSALITYMLHPAARILRLINAMFVSLFVFTILIIVAQGNQTLFIINHIYALVVATLFVIGVSCYTLKEAKGVEREPQRHLRRVRYFTISLYLVCLINIVISLTGTWLSDALYYVVAMLFVLSILYNTFRYKREVNDEHNDQEQIVDEMLSIKGYSEIEKRLEVAIHQDRLFLNPQLSLTDLAAHIGTNRTYLSRYINQRKATSFISYINDFRLEEAHAILKDNQEKLSISEISERCGFASQSTFRRVFKIKYGYAPSDYCRQAK